jgi:hypothetical protein
LECRRGRRRPVGAFLRPEANSACFRRQGALEWAQEVTTRLTTGKACTSDWENIATERYAIIMGRVGGSEDRLL